MHQSAMAVPRVSQKDGGARKVPYSIGQRTNDLNFPPQGFLWYRLLRTSHSACLNTATRKLDYQCSSRMRRRALQWLNGACIRTPARAAVRRGAVRR